MLPNRRLTASERAAWISEYRELGGSNAFELEVIRLVNEIRASHGLSELEIDETLMQAARFYCQTLSNHGLRLGHREGPYGGSAATMRAFGFTGITVNGGNAAGGAVLPSDPVDRWMQSRGHRENMLRHSHTVIGVGSFGGFAYLIMQ
jgi:uncharacterized protein YkwD